MVILCIVIYKSKLMIHLNNLNKVFSSLYSEIHFLAAAAAFALASSHSFLAAPKSLL